MEEEIDELIAAMSTLVDTEDKWAKGANARDSDGIPVPIFNPSAVSFDMYGALLKAASIAEKPQNVIHGAYNRLREAIKPLGFIRNNDIEFANDQIEWSDFQELLGGPSLSPLQLATLGAWDMQEASGALLPAFGDIEIPAFNAPGAASGPAVGLSARSFLAASGQYFEHVDHSIFRAPTSGVKTLRFWQRTPNTLSSLRPILFKANDPTANAAGSEWAIDTTGSGRPRAFVRRADNSAREFLQSGLPGTLGAWVRLELVFDADASEMRLHVNEIAPITVAVPGGFFQGTNPFRIGRSVSDYLEGRMALLVCWGRALTTEERAADQTPRLWADI